MYPGSSSYSSKFEASPSCSTSGTIGAWIYTKRCQKRKAKKRKEQKSKEKKRRKTNEALFEVIPVDVAEELVAFDALSTILEVTETLGLVLGEELLDEIAGGAVKVAGELDAAKKDLLIDPVRTLIVEGRVTGEHLEDEDAQCPPVHFLSVSL